MVFEEEETYAFSWSMGTCILVLNKMSRYSCRRINLTQNNICMTFFEPPNPHIDDTHDGLGE